MRKKGMRIAILLACCLFFCGCGSGKEDTCQNPSEEQGASKEPSKDKDPAVVRDNTPEVKVPAASGITVYGEDDVEIDASNLEQGYVMVRYSGSASVARMLLTSPQLVEYNYRLKGGGTYEAFPLSDGNGTYHLEIYENRTADKYALIYSLDITGEMEDENLAFLYANQYVNFNEDNEALDLAQELAEGARDDLEVVEAVYHYIVSNITYDYDKAKTVRSGYLPDIDETLREKKGICFDYAALMTAMLRSQRIPTRLEIGYREDVYHAWIGVYTREQGWIDDFIIFDGTKWVLMDPTLASESRKSVVQDYMEDADSYYQLRFKY